MPVSNAKLERTSEEQKALERFRKWRWPDGIKCPRCGTGSPYLVKTRGVYRCASNLCHMQFSETSGTPFHARKLTYVGMMAIVDAMDEKRSIRSIAMELGIEWRTVKWMKHKLEGLNDRHI